VKTKLSAGAESRYRVQDYARKPGIEGVVLSDLRRFHDETGSMTELVRLEGGRAAGLEGFVVAQVNFSTLEPGQIKAFHVHRRQTDVWFVPTSDRILLVLADVREGSPTEGSLLRLVLGDGDSRLVRIPPGVAHGCSNVGGGTARIVYFTDLPFSPEPGETDEGRLPWDHFGAGVWDPARD
jgi:dTDP-4-dehydrorhamnose 3,5-epimerase